VVRAAAWASGLHLVGFLVLGWLAARDPAARPGLYQAQSDSAESAADQSDAAWLGVAPADPDLDVPPEPPMGPALPPADQENRDRAPAAPALGLRQNQAPAPDTGDGAGRRLPPSWRRDSSTLRSHLTDGSELNQPERQRIARASSSPQAVRLERTVGVGDSAKTAVPRPTQAAPATELPASTDENQEVAPSLAQETRVPETTGPDPARGQGPLDAERGRRSFDTPADGPARDNQTARAASNETQPGLVDYTTAAARGPEDGTAGKGLGVDPGISSHRVTGTAATTDGWPRPRPSPIGEIGEGTSERQFGREYLEIRRRVAQALRFPKRLALLLEQGEAIVQFMVDRDGRVWGDVKLLKSAGFEEFDREALEVVRRAAPFPQLRQRLLVRMRVPFENPIVR
jgi:TonB family protein